MGESMWDSLDLGGSAGSDWGTLFTLGGGEVAAAPASPDGGGWGWDDFGKAATATVADLAHSWAGYQYNTSPDVIRAKQLGEAMKSGYGYYTPGSAGFQGGGVSISANVLLLAGLGVALMLALKD